MQQAMLPQHVAASAADMILSAHIVILRRDTLRRYAMPLLRLITPPLPARGEQDTAAAAMIL